MVVLVTLAVLGKMAMRPQVTYGQAQQQGGGCSGCGGCGGQQAAPPQASTCQKGMVDHRDGKGCVRGK